MASLEGDQRDVIAFLSNPASYGTREAVEIHETHGALVFLANDQAFKLKRAVKYPYMDYSTRAQRRMMGERELAVNRRMAPELYQEVRAIVADGNSLRFGRPGEANARDWVVVMRRFAQADLLESRRRSGTLLPMDMVTLADAIAAHHAAAEIVPAFGGASGMREIVDENIAILMEKAVGSDLSADVERLSVSSQLWLRRVRDVLGRRRQSGFVRRCHGDLHLNNVCMLDGSPVLFDAIEFNDAFSCIDVFYDLAFMVMDLDRHGLHGHANTLLNRYLEVAGDFLGLAALPLFLSCRAAIRAHVAISTLQKASPGAVEAGEPARLLKFANAYLEPPAAQLIAVGGVSGTGKSTIAHALAPAVGAVPGAIVLRSDVVRKAMMGVPQSQRLDETAYDDATNATVYRRLGEVAGLILGTGHSVIVDAVFGHAHERAQIRDVARDASAPFCGLWLTATLDTIAHRIASRTGDVSDATVAIAQKQLATVTGPDTWRRVSAEGRLDEVLVVANRAWKTP